MIRISREKCYPSRAHPGPAWTWLYRVHAPDPSGQIQYMSGKGIDWAMNQARCAIQDGRGTEPIVRDWESVPAGVNKTVSGSRDRLFRPRNRGGEMNHFQHLYLNRPPQDFNRELVDRFIMYYETATKKTAGREWQDVKQWARERGYPERDMEAARKAALIEHEQKQGGK